MADTFEHFCNLVRRALDGRSKTAVARKAGIPREAIYTALNGHEPRLTRAADICKALDLEFYIGPPRDRPRTIPVPTLSAPAETSAYVSRLTDGLESRGARFSRLGCAWFGAGVLTEIDLDPEYCRAVEVLDSSMSPTLPPESVALADLRRTKLWDGGIFLIGPETRPMLRRIVRDGRGWRSEAINPRWDPRPLRAGDEIMGEALWRSMALPPDISVDKQVSGRAPLVSVTQMETEGLRPWAVPYRGRLEPGSPVEFEPEEVAWFEIGFLRDLGIDPLNAEALTVADNSMMPILCPLAAVLVDRKRTDRRDGAIFLLQTDEALALRRLVRDGRTWRAATVVPLPGLPPPLRSTDRILGEARWTASFLPGSRRPQSPPNRENRV